MVAFPKDAPWGAAIGHQLDLVITVRQLEIDPGQRLAVSAARPKFAESEHTFIKVKLCLQVGDDKSHVHHAMRDSSIWYEFVARLSRPTVGTVLHDLYTDALRISDNEVQVADPSDGNVIRDGDAPTIEVKPHGFRVHYFKGNVIEMIVIRLLLWCKFNACSAHNLRLFGRLSCRRRA